MEPSQRVSSTGVEEVEAGYESRVAQIGAELARLARRSTLISRSRLIAIAMVVALAFPAFVYGSLNGWWIALPLAAFVVLAILHEGVIRRTGQYELRRKFYLRGLSRLHGSWMKDGRDGSQFLHPSHPYAADLDILGPGSLFQLLSCARTTAGEEQLAAWLTAPDAPAEILRRQQAVRELAERLELREELATIAEQTAAAIAPGQLIAWSKTPPSTFSKTERLMAGLLSIVALPLFLLSLPGVLTAIARVNEPRFPALTTNSVLFRVVPMAFLTIALIEWIFARSLSRRIDSQLQGISRASEDLAVIAQVLDLLARQTFTSTLLQELHASLEHDHEEAAARVRQLSRLLELLDSARNQFFAPFAALLLWRTQVTFRIARWVESNGSDIEGWISAIGTFEALSSLGSLAFENPDYTFPVIAGGPPRLETREMVHPLMPRSERIANDALLDETTPLLLVSGSNMSGKSTYLRSVGINTVLALCGSPAAASMMSLTPLRVGASLRIADSLQSGVSHFYAEVQKVKQIVDLTKSGPGALFLLDEIFHGTNSHDRRIGAEAVIRSLLAAGAMGLVTTHDLALASIARETGRNVHFEDTIVDGRMTFDFKLRDGVVEKSNALALMRAVGLDV